MVILNMMKRLSIEDYEKLTNQQYNLLGDGWDESFGEDIVRIAKKIVDLTNVKKDQIKPLLIGASEIKIDNFIIKVLEKSYDKIDSTIKVNVCIFHIVNSKFDKKQIGVFRKVRILGDNRFIGCVWKDNFDNQSKGKSISIDTMVDIVRHLQSIVRMSAFL